MNLPLIKRLLSKLAFFAPGGATLRPWLHKVRGVKMGKNTWIGQYVFIDEVHPENVTIEDNVGIGLRTTIYSHFYWGNYEPGKKVGKVTIKKNAYIGPHCIILHDVTIGEGAVIAAGTVVHKNVAPGVFYGYPPAAPIAKVTRPLIRGVTHKEFLMGLRKL
jgi:acetyltransferase-like isoleucine patch superfamily enzyme